MVIAYKTKDLFTPVLKFISREIEQTEMKVSVCI